MSRRLTGWKVTARRTCLLAVLLWAYAAPAAAATTLSASIPPQSLESALEKFAELPHLSVTRPPEVDAGGLRSPGTHAGLSPQKALVELLQGTGLTFAFAGERTVRIYALPPKAGATTEQPLQSLFVANVLDAQPTLLKRNKGVDVSTLYYATTFRPRTAGVSGTWQF